MRRYTLMAAVLVLGCGGSEKPPPPDTDPAAQQKQQDELKQIQKDLSKKKVKEGIPPEEN